MGKKFFSAAVICMAMLMLCSCNGNNSKTASEVSKLSGTSAAVSESSAKSESSEKSESSVKSESSAETERSEEQSESSDESHEGFTEQELADMEETDKRISDLTKSDEFQQADVSARMELAQALLTELAEEGLVKKGSVYAGGDTVSFQYSCGVLGGVMCREFDPMMN